jgi:hypothetical protein
MVVGLGSVAVVVLVLAAGFASHRWFDHWSYGGDDAAAAALDADTGAAETLAVTLVEGVPSGTCVTATDIDLGLLTETAPWEKVCGVGPPDDRGIQLLSSDDQLVFAYALDGSPFWSPYSCLDQRDDGWLIMFPSGGSGHRTCANGFHFVAG